MRVEIFENRIIKPYQPPVKDGWYELSPEKKKRSSGQNKYLHGILFPKLAEGMSKITGKEISPELAKGVVKKKFLEVFTELGTVEMPTSKLNTKQCMEFVEKCQQYAAEMLGIDIPSPNEQDFSKITEEP